MGYYIQVPENLNKAAQLQKIYQAEIIREPESFDEVPDHRGLICVVENPGFDAAAYCYSEGEFEEFSRIDGRLRTWLLMDKTMVEILSGFTGVRESA